MIAVAAAIQPSQVSALTPEGALTTIGFGVIALLIALVGFLGKKQFDTIINTIHSFSERQVECRETLAERFSDKSETQTHINELYNRTNRHQDLLTRHEALLRGESHG